MAPLAHVCVVPHVGLLLVLGLCPSSAWLVMEGSLHGSLFPEVSVRLCCC